MYTVRHLAIGRQIQSQPKMNEIKKKMNRKREKSLIDEGS